MNLTIETLEDGEFGLLENGRIIVTDKSLNALIILRLEVAIEQLNSLAEGTKS